MRNSWIIGCLLVLVGCTDSKNSKLPPNIIILYADDLGYGDLSSYGATAVQTPAIDKMARNGLRFTDAHCTAATCTPSRISLLTGRYAFRNDAAILPGDAPALISESTPTMAGMLKQQGYATAVIGKWHLGLGNGVIDWNGSIAPGPNEIGFDYSFIIPATTDRVPTVFVENDTVVNREKNDPIAVSYAAPIGNEPTGLGHPELLKQQADSQHSNTIVNGISRIGYFTGGQKARWVDEDIPLVLNAQVKNFITKHQKKPFFLYYPFPNIHVPRAPNERFAGKTSLGARGDVIVEMDWMVNEVMQLLDSLGLAENTLVIFSSDNGPVLDDGYADFAEQKNGSHLPSGPFSGGKYSAFEGGTRVPQIAYWPGTIQPGVSDALFSHIDLFASLATLSGYSIGNGVAMDSQNRLDVLLGLSTQHRPWMLEESFTLSIRKDNWKYIAPQEKPTPDWLRNKKTAVGLSDAAQLFDLSIDSTESINLAGRYPDIVQQLHDQLNALRQLKQ